jgi:hypothetical protein
LLIEFSRRREIEGTISLISCLPAAWVSYLWIQNFEQSFILTLAIQDQMHRLRLIPEIRYSAYLTCIAIPTDPPNLCQFSATGSVLHSLPRVFSTHHFCVTSVSADSFPAMYLTCFIGNIYYYNSANLDNVIV